MPRVRPAHGIHDSTWSIAATRDITAWVRDLNRRERVCVGGVEARKKPAARCAWHDLLRALLIKDL